MHDIQDIDVAEAVRAQTIDISTRHAVGMQSSLLGIREHRAGRRVERRRAEVALNRLDQ